MRKTTYKTQKHHLTDRQKTMHNIEKEHTAQYNTQKIIRNTQEKQHITQKKTHNTS